jgi:hypothetical protein
MIRRKRELASACSTYLLYTHLSPHPPRHHPSSHISQVSRHRNLRTWPINSISNNGGATDSSLLIGMAGLAGSVLCGIGRAGWGVVGLRRGGHRAYRGGAPRWAFGIRRGQQEWAGKAQQTAAQLVGTPSSYGKCMLHGLMYDTAPGVNYFFEILCKSVGNVVVVSCGRWSGGCMLWWALS